MSALPVRQHHPVVGLLHVPEAVLLSLASSWLEDRDAAALARANAFLLRTLRQYRLKTTISVAHAAYLTGFDVPPPSDEATSSTSLHAQPAIVSNPAAAAASTEVKSGRKFTFGTPQRVFIDSEEDFMALPFLPQLRRVSEVILGRVGPDWKQAFSPSMSLLSLEYLTTCLPPSLTRLGTNPRGSLHLCVSSAEALAGIVLPPSLTELVIPTFVLDPSKFQRAEQKHYRRTPTAPLEHLSLPSGLKTFDLRPTPCADLEAEWEQHLHGLQLPAELRVLRMRMLEYLQSTGPPLAGIVLPPFLEELELDVSEVLLEPLSALRLPDSLRKLTFTEITSIEGLQLPPRLESLTLIQEWVTLANTPIRLAPLNPLPATLTALRVKGKFDDVDISDLILPEKLQVFDINYERLSSSPDLSPTYNSLVELKQLDGLNDQLGSMQQVRELRFPYDSEFFENLIDLPPNLTRLHVEDPSALLHFRFPDSLLQLYVNIPGVDEYYEEHPLLALKSWPPRLELISYRSEAQHIIDLPLHMWSPPDSITSLTFASWPSALKLNQVRWPPRLVHLSIGRVHPRTKQNPFEETIRTLSLDGLSPAPAKRHAFLAPPAEQPCNWPESLTSLHLIDGYSEAMAHGYLPPNLRELYLSHDWNAPPSETYFPPSLTCLVFGQPSDYSDKKDSIGPGSVFAYPLAELLTAIPDGLIQLRIYNEAPLPSEHRDPSGEDVIRTSQTCVNPNLQLPSCLRQLHLQSRDRLADGWHELLQDRPHCATFFARHTT